MPPKIDEKKCEGCGNCVNLCPGDVFEMQDEKAVIVREDDCLDCGSCAEECPSQAINFID